MYFRRKATMCTTSCEVRWLQGYVKQRVVCVGLTGAQYSGKEVDNLESAIDQNVAALVNLLETYVSANKPFDFGRKVQYFTLDVISDIAFGAPFGDLATDSDVYEYVSTMEENLPTMMLTTVLPWLLSLLMSPLFKRMLPSEKDALGLGKTMA